MLASMGLVWPTGKSAIPVSVQADATRDSAGKTEWGRQKMREAEEMRKAAVSVVSAHVL